MTHRFRALPLVGLTVLIALSAGARPLSAQSSGEREFAGTINNTIRVRLRLSQSGTVLTGSYAYEKIGKDLQLKGTVTVEQDFHLNEFDEGGKQTGRFDGTFASKDWLEGTWTSTATKKAMPFRAFALDGKQIPVTSQADQVSGQYKRVDAAGRFDRHAAALTIWLLKDGQVRVVGYSSWIGNASTGDVNVGNDEGIVALQGNQALFKGREGDCHFTIAFGRDSLLVTEDNLQCGGLNVSFDGKYRRVGPAKSPA